VSGCGAGQSAPGCAALTGEALRIPFERRGFSRFAAIGDGPTFTLSPA
jgi:hypothetical protein